MSEKKSRFLVYTIGMVVLTLGLTLNTLANLGVSPIISVLYSISQIIGLNFINITFVVYAICGIRYICSCTTSYSYTIKKITELYLICSDCNKV